MKHRMNISLNTVFKGLSNKSIPRFSFHVRKKHSSQDLFEIGHFNEPKQVTNYTVGQTFVHKLLGYRGLIIFPWITRVYTKGSEKDGNASDRGVPWGFKHKKSYYYQVLIDSRDIPFTRITNEPIPHAMKLEKALHPLPDSDHAAHNDILPYTETHKQKFEHVLLDHFFLYHPGKEVCYEAKEELKKWQDNNSKRLELTDVHEQVTENVRLTVMPVFIGLRKNRRYVRFFWRYIIRLENLDKMSVKVKKHKLRIFGSYGSSSYKSGEGVAGVVPVLSKEAPVFQCSSFVSLPAPCGHVHGALELQREDGTSIRCNLPMLPLRSDETC